MSDQPIRTSRFVTRAIGQEIRKRRVAAGYTQRSLARALDLDYSAVAKWETGDRVPSVAFLYVLADELGCRAGDLIP